MTEKVKHPKANETSFKPNQIANPNGRIPIKIDILLVQKYCEHRCTQEEICEFLDVNHETLTARLKDAGYANYSQFYKIHSVGAKMSLRRLQWEAAELGSVPMLIWLGKQILGQKEPDRKDETTVIVSPESIAAHSKLIEENKKVLKQAAQIRRETLTAKC